MILLDSSTKCAILIVGHISGYMFVITRKVQKMNSHEIV